MWNQWQVIEIHIKDHCAPFDETFVSSLATWEVPVNLWSMLFFCLRKEEERILGQFGRCDSGKWSGNH